MVTTALIGIINFTFFLAVIGFIAGHCKFSFSRALPCTVSVLLCLLIFLAIINKLNWIDFISPIGCLLLIFLIIRKKSYSQINFWEILLFLGAAGILCYLCRNHISHASDELRYWALETKTIFYLNGFSSKGNETAFLYGDYHPGLPLFMWWVCHYFPDRFHEGLMYAGYWILFSIPVISVLGTKLDWKRFIGVSLFIAIMVIFLPSVFSSAVYETIGAELPLAGFFALLLNEMFQTGEKKDNTIYVSLICLIMTFLKSAGLLWAVVGLIIGEIYSNKDERSILRLLAILIPSFVFLLGWKIYCQIMERTTYLSQDFSIKSILDKQNITEMAKYIKSYVQAFLQIPLHMTEGVNGITAIILVLGYTLLTIILKMMKLLSKREALTIGISYLVVQLLFFLAIIFLCTYVFKEIYYYDANIIISIISRYGIILFLGFTLFYIFLLKEKLQEVRIFWKIGFALAAIGFTILFSEKDIVRNELIFSGTDRDYILVLRDTIKSKYSDAFSQKKGVIIIENRDKEEYWWEERFIRYYGAPTKIILESSSDENLTEDAENFQKQYGICNVFLYGFNDKQ